MRFDIYEFRHIVSNIDDLLFISGCCQPINISVDRNDDAPDNVFMKLAFPLINGNAEIRIYQSLEGDSYAVTIPSREIEEIMMRKELV